MSLLSPAEVGRLFKATWGLTISLYPGHAVRGLLGCLGPSCIYLVTGETEGNKRQRLCWGHGANRAHMSPTTQGMTSSLADKWGMIYSPGDAPASDQTS